MRDYKANSFQMNSSIFQFGLTPIQFTVYSYLKYCSGSRYACSMKLQTIASVCECSRSSVKRALTVLRDRGFIDIKGGAQKLHGKGHRQTCNRYYLLDTRQSQGQIGVISAPICAFCHRPLGGFSVVSVQPCPLFSDSGSKLGQAQSSRIPLTSKVELIYIERGSPGRKLFGLFSYIPKLR